MQDTDASTRRLTRTAAATLERTFTTRPDLRGSVADLAATWLLASPGRVSRDSAGRLRLSGEARATLGKLGRTLQWMSSPSHHKGQQAARIAAKTLRGLDCNRLTFAGLLDLAAEFQAARFGHIRANAQAIPRAPSTRIVLDAEGTVATRITSLAELRRLGRELGNCLNDSVMAPQYGRELRVGETEFWRIDVGQEATPRWGISIATSSNSVIEIDHHEGGAASLRDRRMLLVFLAARRAMPPIFSRVHGKLMGLGIGVETIGAAMGEGDIRQLTASLGGVDWRLEASDGALAGWVDDPVAGGAIGPVIVASWFLHGNHFKRPGANIPVLGWATPWARRSVEEEIDDEIARGEEDGFSSPPLRYVYEAAIRIELRHACRADGRVHDLCLNAFRNAPHWFLEDWFGDLGRPGPVHP